MALDLATNYLDDDPLGLATAAAKDRADLTAMHQELLRQRDAILALPRNETGINLNRLHAYRESLGMPYKISCFLDPEEYHAALSIRGYASDATQHASHGIYLGGLDIVLVQRIPELEEQNGTEFIEATAMHEWAHSWVSVSMLVAPSEWRGLFRKRLHKMGSAEWAMRGFLSRNAHTSELHSSVLEEAYAELEEGLYIEAELGNRLGGRFGGKRLPAPTGYFEQFKSEPAVYKSHEAGAGARVLEAVVELDPSILPLLRLAHMSEQHMPELERRVEAIYPGLFAWFMNTTTKDQDYIGGAEGYSRALQWQISARLSDEQAVVAAAERELQAIRQASYVWQTVFPFGAHSVARDARGLREYLRQQYPGKRAHALRGVAVYGDKTMEYDPGSVTIYVEGS